MIVTGMSFRRRIASLVARRSRRYRSSRVLTAVLAVVALVVVGGVGVAIGLSATRPNSAAAAAAPGSAAANSAAPDASGSAPRVDTAGFPHGQGGIFTDTCTRTKTAADDPILMPGMAGKSMQHEFFGNTGTTASSTPKELVAGSTSCSTAADASAYWVPVLYQHGAALHPQRTLLYWRAPHTTAHAVKTIPAGLTIVAGNEGAMQPQGVQKVKWSCAGVDGRGTASPQDCANGAQLRLTISFPSCWDGHTLGGATQTNVVYPSKPNAACPASHPVQIPQIVFHANYPTSSAADLILSMGPTVTGPVTTEHADFMNGWNADVLAADVHACTASDVRCGPTSGAQATPKGGKTNAQRQQHQGRMKRSRSRDAAPQV